jgi:hypothetical protein
MEERRVVMVAAYKAMLAAITERLGKDVAEAIKREAAEELMQALDITHESRKTTLEWPRPHK